VSSENSEKRGAPWTRRRRIVQISFVAFFLILPLTNRWGNAEVIGTLAALKVGPISLVDPAAGISSILAARTVHSSMLTGLILPVLLAFVLGPVFCSWVCPWGLVSETIDRLLRRKPRRWAGSPHRLRWSLLGAFFLLSLGLGSPIVATLSAPRLITALPLELIFLGGASAGTLTLLGLFLLFEFILPRRLWCRALCPVGSTLALIRMPKTLTVGWNAKTCQTGGCGIRCFRSCPWNLDPRRMGGYDGCTNCAACIEACPPEPEQSLSFTIRGLGERAEGEMDR